MTKKKILIITFSCIGVVILAVIGLLLGLNWNKIASWFNGAQVYTYEEIQAATEDAYNKGVKEREALIKQVEDYKSQVDKLLTKVDSLNVDNSLKDEEISSLKAEILNLEKEIEALKKTITGSTLTETELTEELSYLQDKLNERLKSKWNEGYNEGFIAGFQSATLNLPEGSFALVVSPNLPLNCSSDFVGTNEIIVGKADENLYLPTNNLILPGYIFKGYSFESDASESLYLEHEILPSNTLSADSLTILYCIWEPINYTINFYANLPEDIIGETSFSYSEKYYVLGLTSDTYSFEVTYDKPLTFTSKWSYYCVNTIGICNYGNKQVGWALTPDGNVVYSMNNEFLNLTDVDGDVVNLYAVYEFGDWPSSLESGEQIALLNSQTQEILYFVPEVFTEEILPNNIGCYIVSDYSCENSIYSFSLEGAVGKFSGRDAIGYFYVSGIGRLIFNGTTDTFCDSNAVEYYILPYSAFSILD